MLRTGELLDPLKGLCHDASPVGSRLAAAVSYRAAWSLPGPDFHRLVSVNLHEVTCVFQHLLSWVPRYLGTRKPGQPPSCARRNGAIQTCERVGPVRPTSAHR